MLSKVLPILIIVFLTLVEIESTNEPKTSRSLHDDAQNIVNVFDYSVDGAVKGYGDYYQTLFEKILKYRNDSLVTGALQVNELSAVTNQYIMSFVTIGIVNGIDLTHCTRDNLPEIGGTPEDILIFANSKCMQQVIDIIEDRIDDSLIEVETLRKEPTKFKIRLHQCEDDDCYKVLIEDVNKALNKLPLKIYSIVSRLVNLILRNEFQLNECILTETTKASDYINFISEGVLECLHEELGSIIN